MEFLDRKWEFEVLDKAAGAKGFSFVVIFGRRRIGKSRLLLEWNRRKKGIYYVADESAATVQRKYFAEALSGQFPGMEGVEYPDWKVLFRRLTQEIRREQWRGPLIIDELLYLVEASKELASVMQNWIDQDLKGLDFTLVIAGSSQSMMQGLVLSGDSPLYGRATEVIKIGPLALKHMKEGMGIESAVDQVKAYAVWGGVPRYWELAEGYGNKIEEAAYELVLKPQGILSQEPDRLLLEERPSAVSLRPILDAIGMGAHKASEIAARLGQSSTSLSKGLHRLQELDLVEREIPFGESEKSGKRSLYKIKDPLFRLWFELISGRQGQIAGMTKVQVMKLLAGRLPHLTGKLWEDLCRRAFLNLPEIGEGLWLPPLRYWHRNGYEWDLVSTTMDGASVAIGECKWFTGEVKSEMILKAVKHLKDKGVPPLSKGGVKAVRYYLFIPELPRKKMELEEDVRLIDVKRVVQSIV